VFETLVFGVERGGIVAGMLGGGIVIFEEVVVEDLGDGAETGDFDVIFL
jgi:hypothetical protein